MTCKNLLTRALQVVGSADAKGVEAQEPAVSVDLWAAIQRMFPHKVRRVTWHDLR